MQTRTVVSIFSLWEEISTLNIITYTGLVFLIYLLCLPIHNLYLHPLHKFPGPLLARTTIIWKLRGNLLGLKAHRIHAAHLKYGPIVRTAPNELSFSDPESARQIYTSGDFGKENAFYFAKRIFHENHLLSFRDNDVHKKRKKLLQRGFSQASMLEFEPAMGSKIESLLGQMAKARQPVDIYPWVHWLGFDIVYHLMFDEDPGSVSSGKPHWVLSYMKQFRPTFIYKELVPQLEWLGPYVPGYIGGYFRSVQVWKVFAMEVITKVRTQGTKTPFLANALNGVDEALGRALTDSELAEESMGGMFGGSGTTANTFVYFLWAVLRNREVKRRLHEELDAAFEDKRAVPLAAECGKLEYLQAVISETLRRYPTIIATLPRVALCDSVVNGVAVKKGTVVASQNYTIHRNEDAFPDAEKFDPSRWLKSEGDAARKHAFVPFSVGQRSCMGINLAKMELSKLTAAFFLRFDAELDECMKEEQMEMFDQFSASPVGGQMWIRVKERN